MNLNGCLNPDADDDYNNGDDTKKSFNAQKLTSSRFNFSGEETNTCKKN